LTGSFGEELAGSLGIELRLHIDDSMGPDEEEVDEDGDGEGEGEGDEDEDSMMTEEAAGDEVGSEVAIADGAEVLVGGIEISEDDDDDDS
jgi:hypothetical protein